MIVGAQYGLSVDMWAVGVVAYMLLCGYAPFRPDTDDKVRVHFAPELGTCLLVRVRDITAVFSARLTCRACETRHQYNT